MNRERRYKTLECAGCGKPVQAGAEAARVMCEACAAAGRDFPRTRQLELFGGTEGEKEKARPSG